MLVPVPIPWLPRGKEKTVELVGEVEVEWEEAERGEGSGGLERVSGV